MKMWCSALGVVLLLSASQLFAENSKSVQNARGLSEIASIGSVRALKKRIASPALSKNVNQNLRPVLEMLTHLERRGAEVNIALEERKGNTFMQFAIDGELFPPLLVQCDECVIVFEY